MAQQAGTTKMVFLICLAGAFMCCVLLYLCPHVYLIKLGYTIESLAAQRRQLWEEQQVLKLEAATMRAPGRIEAWAAGEGGMVFPRRGQVVYLMRE